jgi:hypothetical protein
VLEEMDRVFGQQPWDVQPDMRDGNFPEHLPQAGSMIGIRVSQHHVLDRDKRSEMLLEMGNKRFTAIRCSTIDDHQLVGSGIAIADNNSVPRTATVTHSQEFDFAEHGIQ